MIGVRRSSSRRRDDGPPAQIEVLLAALRQAATFHEAALVALREVHRTADAALQASPFARAGGRIVRGAVHLRSDDGYRSFMGCEYVSGRRAGAPAAPPSAAPPMASASVWRWVIEHASPVAVDLPVGKVSIGTGPTRLDRAWHEEPFASAESRARLIDRDVTHLFALPLRGPGARIVGMISVEAHARDAIGRPFVWEACAGALERVADAAAPYLASLPSVASTPAPVSSDDPLLPVVGASMAPVVALLRAFAQQDDPLLLTGPTGAGKSRLARWSHEQSAARGKVFETVDLSAIPSELQLAELFGWRRGAFTGAVRDHAGAIARAEGGTLFIDEVGNLSSRAQTALLRVLEERTYRAVGQDGAEQTADVRFILGTNDDLAASVREGRFREDLFYRIHVLPVRVPPLRERIDEIPRWAEYMARRHHAKRAPGSGIRVTPAAAAVLASYAWPGNLRQLDNVVRRAYALAGLSAAHDAGATEMTLEEAHVRHALAYDGAEGEGAPLLQALLAAAEAFVVEAERTRDRPRIDLDLADCFKGFVLGVAAQRPASNRDDAFRLLGCERLVAGRNHHKALRRELGRVQKLCSALGRESEFPFPRLAADLPDEEA